MQFYADLEISFNLYHVSSLCLTLIEFILIIGVIHELKLLFQDINKAYVQSRRRLKKYVHFEWKAEKAYLTSKGARIFKLKNFSDFLCDSGDYENSVIGNDLMSDLKMTSAVFSPSLYYKNALR